MKWQAAGDEALELLQALLKIDTSNPPGNELPAAELLADALRDDGIEPVVLESADRRGNVVARLNGNETGGGGPRRCYRCSGFHQATVAVGGIVA